MYKIMYNDEIGRCGVALNMCVSGLGDLNHRPRPYQECGLRNIFAAIIGSVLPAHRVAGQVERDMAVSGVTAINPEVRPSPVVFNRTRVELSPNNPPGGYDRAETARRKSGVAHSITERLNRAPAWQQVSVLARGRSSAWHTAWSTVLRPQLCTRCHPKGSRRCEDRHKAFQQT